MEALSTKDRVLEAAEQLFAEHGFASTSLRRITHEAGANLAAVNYYFGTKEALLEAVLRRRFDPINAERLQMLDEAEASAGGGAPEVEQVLRALFVPIVNASRRFGDEWSRFLPLIGRLHSELDENLVSIFLGCFQEVRLRFLAALEKALPDLPADLVFWRGHFVVGSMAHTLLWHRAYHDAGWMPRSVPDLETMMEMLVDFAAAGFRAPHGGEPRGGAS